MNRKDSLSKILSALSMESNIKIGTINDEINNSKNLLSNTYVRLPKPMLVSYSETEGKKNAYTKVYAYAITCDGKTYLLFRDEYKDGQKTRTNFKASVAESIGFLNQNLSDLS